MIYIGIDPGLSGGIAIVSGRACQVYDVPIEEAGKGGTRVKKRVDARGAWEVLLGAINGRPARGALERVTSRPGEGVASAFSFGDTFGTLRAVASMACEPLHLPRPAQWKRDMGIPAGAGKEYSIEMARALYPSAADRLTRKKDHDRAEAILLAQWARLVHRGEITYG